jgi:hypothetical protein
MKYAFLRDDVYPKKKAHGGDLSVKRKFPYPKVNISLKLNISEGCPFKEDCSLFGGAISLEMTPPGKHLHRDDVASKSYHLP